MHVKRFIVRKMSARAFYEQRKIDQSLMVGIFGVQMGWADKKI